MVKLARLCTSGLTGGWRREPCRPLFFAEPGDGAVLVCFVIISTITNMDLDPFVQSMAFISIVHGLLCNSTELVKPLQ